MHELNTRSLGTKGMGRSALRRAAAAGALALTPVVALTWTACSDDETKAQSQVRLDPGGTFGAEIVLDVVGRGRVTGSIRNSIDCPTNCYVRYTFEDPNAPLAAEGLTLRAIPTPGATFKGWRFAAEEIATRGRGPENCNPVRRAAAVPAGGSQPEINLPFGQTEGVPPEGQEATCGGFNTVPLVYRVTAEFDDPPVEDSGIIEEDAGGPVEIVAQPSPAGSIARGIGVLGSLAYWHYQLGTTHGVSYASTSAVPSTAAQIPASGTITHFEVDQSYVVYQTSTAGVFAIQGGSNVAVAMAGSTTAGCTALTSDASFVYCRTSANELWRWTASNGAGPELMQVALPPGTDLFVDSSYIYFSDSTIGTGAIYYVSKSLVSDAGAGNFTAIVTARSFPRRLDAYSFSTSSTYRLAWLEGPTATSATAFANTSRFTDATQQIHPLTTGLKHIVVDPSNPTSSVWLATDTQILRTTMNGAVTPTEGLPFRTFAGATVGGIAVDASYVYWTRSDGRVYRAVKTF